MSTTLIDVKEVKNEWRKKSQHLSKNSKYPAYNDVDWAYNSQFICWWEYLCRIVCLNVWCGQMVGWMNKRMLDEVLIKSSYKTLLLQKPYTRINSNLSICYPSINVIIIFITIHTYIHTYIVSFTTILAWWRKFSFWFMSLICVQIY